MTLNSFQSNLKWCIGTFAKVFNDNFDIFLFQEKEIKSDEEGAFESDDEEEQKAEKGELDDDVRF
jgi:hypothetical protein